MKRVIGPNGKKYFVYHRESYADGTFVIEVNTLFRNVHTYYTNSKLESNIVEFYKTAIKDYEENYKMSARVKLKKWDGDMRNE